MPNFAWQTYGWRLSRNLVFVCVYRMTYMYMYFSTMYGQAHGRLTGFLRTDFLRVHGMSHFDTRQQWTSLLFSWMLCLIPLSKTCSFDWLGRNFYRRVNFHCHEAFHMKGGSSLFDRALITGLTVVYIVIQLYGLGWIKTNALNKLAIQNSKCQWKRRLFVCPDLDHWQQKFLMAGEKKSDFHRYIKNNFKCFVCFEWIINCLSNNQKLTPELLKF